MKNSHYTLITGASAGIGEAFAKECARRKFNLVLVARNIQKLEELASQIRKDFDVSVHICPMDLTKENAAKEIFDFCETKNLNINILINNAGLGFTNKFENLELDYCEQLVRLNNLAPLKLMRLFAPKMKELEKANIINISSMAGLFTVPYKSLYAATKHFTTALSFTLYQEYKDTNLHFSTVCPGGVPTNERVSRRMQQYSGLKKASFTSAEFVVRESLNKSLMGKVLIIPGILNQLSYYLVRFLPLKLRLKVLENTIAQELELLELK